MKKYLIIGGIVVVIALGVLIFKPEPPFGATDDTTIVKLQTKYDLATEIKAKYVLDNGTLVKTDIKNPELDKYKGEPKDEVRVQIGNKPDPNKLGASATNFEPSITLTRWNEVDFKITPDISAVALKDRTLKFENDKILFETSKMNFEMYDVPISAENPEGAYKFIWYLNEKPATNKVSFKIETSGLDFFYQPALNVENKDPNLTCTETQCKDINGNVLVKRPENVVGSYAVYHSTKGGMNDINGKDYKVGKAFHIYRPHIIDANGAETWGILHIENGIYSVEIPQDFLDTAVYPIKSNDYLGYTTKGLTDGTIAQRIDATTYGAYRKGNAVGTANGTVTSISAYLRTYSASDIVDTRVFMNIENTGTDSHNQAVALTRSNLSLTTTTTQYDFDVADTVISDTNQYILSAVGDGTDIDTTGNKLIMVWDAQTEHNTYSETFTGSGGFAAAAEDPWTEDEFAYTTTYSIYATYTPSGGGAVEEDPPIIIIVD
jgi:hypothetical protein